ncbi:hypothetical protein GCM10009733_094600 [Nonomuraea maheshkhaliensis]|uniref:Uncharacterized protein n=1 Tax=Nonomuraea maheshkhaliensis TaxID=419590 RepID=A0ABN2H847_9ACTN
MHAVSANVAITVMITVRGLEPADIASIVSYETKGMRVDLCHIARSVAVHGAVNGLRLRRGATRGRYADVRQSAGEQRSGRHARRVTHG